MNEEEKQVLYDMYDLRVHALLLDQPKEEKDYSVLDDYNNFKDILSFEEYDSCRKIYKARKQKTWRVGTWIKEMLDYHRAMPASDYKNIVFGTMTLDDHNLNQKEDTYIRKIHGWLQEHFDYYVLNKDFGDATEREHYHFIGLTIEPMQWSGKKSKKGYPLLNLKNQNYKLGFEPDIEIMDLTDREKVKHYLLKINKHSNKKTTKGRTRRWVSNKLKLFFEKRKV